MNASKSRNQQCKIYSVWQSKNQENMTHNHNKNHSVGTDPEIRDDVTKRQRY